MKKTLQLEGLDCAACAAELEEEILKTEGVIAASVSFMTQKLIGGVRLGKDACRPSKRRQTVLRT